MWFHTFVFILRSCRPDWDRCIRRTERVCRFSGHMQFSALLRWFYAWDASGINYCRNLIPDHAIILYHLTEISRGIGESEIN
jgi:hypothetical protein